MRSSAEWIITMHGRSLPAILSGFAYASLGLGLGLGSGPARADAISSLIAGHGSVQVGGLLFDQFSYSPTGQMPSAANVDVIPIFDADGNPGLRFTGGFADAYDGTHGAQQASDATLSYRVTSLGPLLDGIHLSGNPQLIGPGDGVMSVAETFQAGNQSPIQLEIHDSVNGGVASMKLRDSALFGPLPSLQVVTKDILGLNLGAYPTASFIDQTFTTSTPEPGSILVLGLGFVTAAVYRWRRGHAAGS
jgi:hypothetical protein